MLVSIAGYDELMKTVIDNIPMLIVDQIQDDI